VAGTALAGHAGRLQSRSPTNARDKRLAAGHESHQQQLIEALTAGVQKVSAAVELNIAAPIQVADTR